ncbi:endothelin-converting enzyme homolog isoform X1 [Montipora capricornis]|uniref:endothelin-converting enzyme homolog isoform X1 n=1 Tax=Montipora capricornis TaxID=246305 RepID=UPI0035F21410
MADPYGAQNGVDAEFGLQSATSTETLGVGRSTSTFSVLGEKIYRKENKRVLRLGLAVFCFVLLVACIVLAVFLVIETRKPKETGGTRKENSEKLIKCSSRGCMRVASAVKQNMNESIDPCTDFFQYSCGNWITNNPILPSENSRSTFGDVNKRNNENLLLRLLETNDDLPNSHAVRKTRLYFKSCMNEDGVDATALQKLQWFIDHFGSWPLRNTTWNESTWSVFETSAKMQRDMFQTPVFKLGINTDPQNSSRFVLEIHPPELSLIREQYLAKENKTRLAYLDFMTKVGEILDGGDTTRQQMQDVMEFEGKLAEIIPPRSEIYSKYHQSMNLTELERKAPGIGFTWVRYLNSIMSQFNIRINDSDRVLVPSPEYLKNMSIIVNGTDKRTLSNYVMWTFVSSMIPYLSREFRGAFLDYQKATGGQKAAKPRWLSCVEDINSFHNGLTFALGYLWVTSSFDVEIIPFIEEMMGGIKTAFRDETPRYDWVDEQTRRKILQKEAAMKTKVGFPELCANETLLNNYYQNLSISGNYLENALGVMSWRRRNFLSRLRTPVDKQEWYTGPQIVNAFYLPSRNEINILAGILQPPFYYGRKAPRAVNYGAIGMILAHELSHGFDATGRKFNKDGEITENWWTNFTTKGFEKRAQCMVDQYNKYSVDGGERGPIQINGKLTLSENIADNGGVRMSYWAYKNWVKKNGEEKLLPGLNKTNEQLLFVSFAQMWCSSYNPQEAYRMTMIDTHTLAKYRVIGALSNMKEFSDAFNCPAGTKMNPEKKCHVW